MKQFFFILILSLSFSAVAQMATTDVGTQAAISANTAANLEQFAKENAETAAIIDSNIKTVTENIKKAREVIAQINSIGKVASALGKNGQDMMDTVNQLSDLFGGSTIFNKSIEEMTSDELITGNEEIANFRKKSIEVLGKIDDFADDTMSRIDNMFNTADLINEASLALGGPGLDKNYHEIKKVVKYGELASRQMEVLISAVKGQNMMTQIEKSLDIVEEGIAMKQAEEAGKKHEKQMKEFFEFDNDKLAEFLGDSEAMDNRLSFESKMSHANFKQMIQDADRKNGVNYDFSATNW